MKKITALMIILSLGVSIVHAQKKVFIRVYDVSGKKSAKGFLRLTTDSSVVLGKDSTAQTEIHASKIGYIKTKRSAGHTILVSSLLGGGVVGIVGATTGEAPTNDGSLDGTFHDALTPTPAEGFVAGFFLGATTGAVAGGIISVLNRHHTFQINGSLENFKQQKAAIDQLRQ